MGGIEVLAFTVIFIMGTAGIIRGPNRELGVTMSLVVLLAILTQINSWVGIQTLPARVNTLLGSIGLASADALRQGTMVVFLFSALVLLTAFLAYHGQDTLSFKFRTPPGIWGVLAGFVVGLVNGYLLVGTIWYYLDVLNYPIQRYPWFEARFTETATTIVQFLPQNVFSGLVLSALALVLLWWRILK